MIEKYFDNIVCFIDLDNTIIKSPYKKIFNNIIRDISEITGRENQLIRMMINKEFKKREINKSILAFDWDNIISTVCNGLGTKWDNSLEYYIKHHIQVYGIHTFEHVKVSLKYIKLKNIKIYCASNGFYSYQEPLLRHTGLLQLFDDLLTSDRVGCVKSLKQFYMGNVKKSDKIIVIGDSYKYDIYYPKIFGFISIWDVEALLRRTIAEKYSTIAPAKRPSVMKNELSGIHKKQADDIYSQAMKNECMPDYVIFKFDEIIPIIEKVIKRISD